jgi:hypothetical protein
MLLEHEMKLKNQSIFNLAADDSIPDFTGFICERTLAKKSFDFGEIEFAIL